MLLREKYPFFQRKENLQKPLRGNVFARPAIGNIPVLAEDAAQIAAGEKHRAAAEASGNDRLFPIMQRGPRGKNMIRHLAEAALPCRPVDAAGARAERAVTIIQHKTQLQSSSCLPV